MWEAISQATYPPFIFLLIVGIPSLILYITEVFVLVSNASNFRTAFFRLFIVRSISNLFNYFCSYFYMRLGCLGLFIGLFQAMPFPHKGYFNTHPVSRHWPMTGRRIEHHHINSLSTNNAHKFEHRQFGGAEGGIASHDILRYIAAWIFQSDPDFFVNLANKFCWVHDINNIVLPAWFLLWASRKVRERVCSLVLPRSWRMEDSVIFMERRSHQSSKGSIGSKIGTWG
ncbi:hypothetical protein DdX_20239 [Ditylenchus destructor]|uniref:Serpentine receptor class gamma n=1 Tax=Ditylenchus destructor TaxID=166010 RepID=A0AAD4QTR3_9BILA|nr:hypothetical protein DdX_20239 [Ditylenchus destructor]